MFIDEVKIYTRSGNGGNGMVHFRREKYISKGGPDGGDGGRGGDVVLQVKVTLNNLAAFRHQNRYIAENGGHGGVQKQTGSSAQTVTIYIPPGTIVYDEDTDEVLGDLLEAQQELLVCKGGRGGKGNVHFASSRNQAPRLAEKGEPGQERNLRLELKLIADIGIIGVPNAGKSSLLAAVSNAKPKIADYPFTTLEPNLGVVDIDAESAFVVADIPGLIDGAHDGAGLGDTFLRHIQRTRILIHLLDGQSGDPLADFTQINNELALFDPGLMFKPQVVVLNKMDLPEAQEIWPRIKEELEKRGYHIFAISALKRNGLQPLLLYAMELLKKLPIPDALEQMPVYRPNMEPQDFKILKVSEGWRVQGSGIERAAQMTYWEYPASVRRFQRLMEKIGLEKALRKAGIQQGETVLIGDNQLEWQD